MVKKKKHTRCSFDPFLVISKIVENGGPVPLCKTDVIKNNLNLIWKSVVLNLQQVGCKVIDQFTLEYASPPFFLSTAFTYICLFACRITQLSWNVITSIAMATMI